MPKLLSSKEIVKVLENEGFVFVSQKGSHAKYRKRASYQTLNVIVPMSRKEVPVGTFRSILRQSQIAEEKFY